jgi:hypothetical protein
MQLALFLEKVEKLCIAGKGLSGARNTPDDWTALGSKLERKLRSRLNLGN